MKIRWMEQVVRFRITPTELSDLIVGNSVQEELSMLGGKWTAQIDPNVLESGLEMQGNCCICSLSASDLLLLSAPDSDGVYFEERYGQEIRFYIEKDFPCVHPRASEAPELTKETFNPPVGFEARKAP